MVIQIFKLPRSLVPMPNGCARSPLRPHRGHHTRGACLYCLSPYCPCLKPLQSAPPFGQCPPRGNWETCPSQITTEINDLPPHSLGMRSAHIPSGARSLVSPN